MLLVLKFFVLAYTALLPVVNPLGSALMFLAVVGSIPPERFRHLARRVATSMVLFLLVFEVGGAALLNFFGISLPAVQLAGGFALGAMGLRILGQDENTNALDPSQVGDPGALDEKIFYPLTFPISAGPACLVVTLTLSAHASRPDILDSVFAHLGMALAIIGLGVTIWFFYAYAPRITQKVAPTAVQGILRLVGFALLCIGVQIAWNGVEALIRVSAK